MSKTIIKKVRKENPFIMLDKTCVNEIELTLSAKGLHTYIMGLPDDWTIYLEEVSKHSRDSYETVIKAMDELIVYGFATKERLRNENGQYGVYQYTIFEEPINVDNETIKSILNKSIYKKSKIVHGFKKSDYITDTITADIENTTNSPTSEIPIQVNKTQENPKLLNNNQLNNNLTKYVFDDDKQNEIKHRLAIYKDATNKKINQGVKKIIEKSLALSNKLFEELVYKSGNKNDCFSYLKVCIENCISDKELTLEDYKKDRLSNDKTYRKNNTTLDSVKEDLIDNSYVPNVSYKKTKFHNFTETFTNYSEDEFEDIILKSQRAKFA